MDFAETLVRGLGENPNSALGSFAIKVITICLFAFISLYILQIIAKWKMFEKAGEKGWKSLIPVYSDYLIYKLFWSSSMFFASVVCFVAYYTLSTAGAGIGAGSPLHMLYNIMLALILLINLIIGLALYFKVARAFGKGIGFGIGLFVFNTLFMIILGFGKSKYERESV